jgi:glycosyltransferase involved in cell wall biosynthesis
VIFRSLNAENPLTHLKVIFVVENYWPTKNSGIENYSHWVASILIKSGYRVDVAYLSLGAAKNYEYESVNVIQLPDRLISFEKLLKDEQYDICHFQEFSGEEGIGIKWFKVAAANCNKVFFTFHLPYLTCYKGDFRYMGKDDCDDFSSANRCVKCIVASKLDSEFLSGLVAAIGSGLSAIHVSNPIKKLEEAIEVKNTTLNQMIATCTNVFIYASWFKKILADNGYNQESIKIIPYKTKSIHHSAAFIYGKKPIRNKILFVGRIERQKGLQLLCSAMNIIKSKTELDDICNIV